MSQDKNTIGHKIGRVAQLTGITPDTLRVWERRYSAVTPERTPAGGRLYSDQDVDRLTILKQLVSTGDSISAIARLDIMALQQRLNQVDTSPNTKKIDGPFKVIAIGPSITSQFNDTTRNAPIELIATYGTVDHYEQQHSAEAEILIMALSTLSEDIFRLIPKWLALASAYHIIIVYRFGSSEIISKLKSSHCSVIQAPINYDTLLNQCLAIGKPHSQDSRDPNITFNQPRQFTDQILATIANTKSTIKCECPKHLSELILALSAFEQYSVECEHENEQDVQLHHQLKQLTTNARLNIEKALKIVIETEQLSY